MKIEVCESVCKACPFRKENSHHLNKSDVQHLIYRNIVSPCHMDMVKYTGSKNRGIEKYAEVAPSFKVCRGIALARVRYEFPHVSAVWHHIEEQLQLHPHPDDETIELVRLEDIL